MLARTIRPRECKCGCGQSFIPTRTTQKAFSIECAIRIAREKREKQRQKEERKSQHERRMAIKPLSWWKAKAQAAFNSYVRERDKGAPCISCGRWHDGQWHAGHFRSVGSHPELRFEEDNCHKQCSPCNAHKSGNISEYRPRLIAKIGIERVDSLEGPHPAAHYTREDCQRIEAEYKAKMKELKGKV